MKNVCAKLFEHGVWVCMDFLDHSVDIRQYGNNIIIMENTDHSKAYSSNMDKVEPQDSKYNDFSKFGVSTNNVGTFTSNFNNTHNNQNQTFTYSNNVSSSLTNPICSINVSLGQHLLTNTQIPVSTTQPVVRYAQTPQPQSLTQFQLPAKHNINQSYIPHSNLQYNQMQKVIANDGAIQSQVQQTQPNINVMQYQNPLIKPQSIQNISPIHQNNTIPHQFQQPVSQANFNPQINLHNMPEQFQKTFKPMNESVLPNCVSSKRSVNQIMIKKSPQYYNCPSAQSQYVSSETSSIDLMSNQQFNLLPIQNHPLQKYDQLQQKQKLPPQQMKQQIMLQQNQMQTQIIQQNTQLSHQPHIFQLNQPQQTQYVPQQEQQICQQHQQTPQIQHIPVQQVFSSQRQQTTQIQSQFQQMKDIHSQNQIAHKNGHEIAHSSQMNSQRTYNQSQQSNLQKQEVQQHQKPQQQQIQQLSPTNKSSQSTIQQVLQSNQSIPEQNQVLTQQLGINQKVIQSQKLQYVHQYQQPQPMMQVQPQQTGQPFIHQSIYPQATNLNSKQLQQAVMQIPTNSTKSTQIHTQQQQSFLQLNLVQQPQINSLPQNNIQPIIPISQQQITYSLQHNNVPINPNYVNSVQNCCIPSQQLISPDEPSMKTAKTVKSIKENNNEVTNNANTNSVTIRTPLENRIEEILDLVKAFIMYHVCMEVELLNETIAELMNKIEQLEIENSNLRTLVPPAMLEQYKLKNQKSSN